MKGLFSRSPTFAIAGPSVGRSGFRGVAYRGRQIRLEVFVIDHPKSGKLDEVGSEFAVHGSDREAGALVKRAGEAVGHLREGQCHRVNGDERREVVADLRLDRPVTGFVVHRDRLFDYVVCGA
jgi:hypothetical protein